MYGIKGLIDKLKRYASAYSTPPYGREVTGTKELLLDAADAIESLSAKSEGMKWLPVSEYKEEYGPVLIKYFDGEEECFPQVARRKPDGNWYVGTDFEGDIAIPSWFEVKYFFDTQKLDD